jgi:group I intron endonuclease
VILYRKTGVYCIQNTVNHKRYIGSARCLSSRWSQHQYLLKRGRHHSKSLQRSWDKHGSLAFSFTVIEFCKPNEAVKREQFWIDHFNSATTGYNINPCATSRSRAPCSEETRERIGRGNRGKVATPELRAKLSAIHRGKPKSEAHRASMRAKKYSPEALANYSKAAKNRSLEHRAKISENNRNRVIKAETREKISRVNKGKVISEEQRKKLSASGKAYNARKREQAKHPRIQKTFAFKEPE